jgi:hypothetical protein|tara:strand:- start:24 stop:194 length:171 start_codon:yes stop_codon:yes gene_type:complete
MLKAILKFFFPTSFEEDVSFESAPKKKTQPKKIVEAKATLTPAKKKRGRPKKAKAS